MVSLAPEQGLLCPQLLLLAQSLASGSSGLHTGLPALSHSELWDFVLPMAGHVGFCTSWQQ